MIDCVGIWESGGGKRQRGELWSRLKKVSRRSNRWGWILSSRPPRNDINKILSNEKWNIWGQNKSPLVATGLVFAPKKIE